MTFHYLHLRIRLILGLAGLALLAVSGSAAEFEQARFIAPPVGRAADAACPLFRKEFTLASKPQSATLRIIGLGDYEVSLNGRRLVATAINQPWSEYEKTLYYRDFDVTPALAAGPNCLGVMLYNSFWHNLNPPAGRYNKTCTQRTTAEPYLLCAEISFTQNDGAVTRIGTDATWRLTDGPVVFSHIFGGEDFDARRQVSGWDQAGFDDRSWPTAREAAAPMARLEPQRFPNIATFDHQKPVSIKQVQAQAPAEPAAFLYSFPQNMAAQLRVELEGGKAGDRVGFRCGEHKNAQDRLFGNYVVGCEVITDGRPLTRQWGSFYLGMQFVEVTGAVPAGEPNPLGLPVVRSMELVDVRAALPEVGTFKTSSDLYNGTHRIIDAAMRANMNWVMTDCPHREKLGWLECSYLLAPGFQYRYDCRDWMAKIIRDVRDAQEPSGRVRTVAPGYSEFGGGFQWTVEWGASAALLPWRHYEWYGDVQILRDNFEMMRRFTDYIQIEAKDGLAPGGLGDWYDYGHGQAPGSSRFTPTNLSATATWALSARAVAQAAEVLGRPEEAKRYHELHARIAADLQRHFQDPVTRKLRHTGSPQCSNAMALCAEVVPTADRALLLADLIADLEKRGWQQTAGDIGHVYVIRALAEAGRSDVLHRVYSRDGVGSYGGILKKGLTSLPETWDAMMDGCQSLNHCMLGHVMEWYYGYVGGIRQPAGGIGWKKIIVAPNPGALTHAECTVDTPAGRVVSRWRVDGKKFQLEVEIPAGLEAVAILPSGARMPLRSGQQTLTEAVVPPTSS
jgi:alpha-L-rhamnosidase